MSLLSLLHPGLQTWISEQSWSGLTPIQKAALQPVLNRSNCLIEAPTAGGKTEAVLFPLLTAASKSVSPGLKVLYVAPLRALLNDLETRAVTYAQCCGLTAFKWHGDVSQTTKLQALRDPPDLLLTTPESIEAILLRKPSWRQFLGRIQTIVVDEAHSFASGDRGAHLLGLLERIELASAHRHEPQRVALSATVGNQSAMAQWIMGARPGAQVIRVPASPRASHDDIRIFHFDFSTDTDDTPFDQRAGMKLLAQLSHELEGRKAIAFARSRMLAEDIAKAIHQYAVGRIRLRTHHSAVSKFFREDAEGLIRLAGEQGIDTIVSTSTLELGIDIGELDSVIQMGALSSPGAFLQRVGRTGRRPGVPRRFRGFTQREDDLLILAATVSLGLENRSEPLRLKTRPFHILAHQVLCLALQMHGTTQEGAWKTLSRSHAFSRISDREFSELIEHMCSEGYLRRADGLLIPGETSEKVFLRGSWRELFAVFNTAPLYEVYEGRNQVGTLDTSFVTRLEAPFHFSLAGHLWKAVSIDPESRKIKAQRAKHGITPRWHSFGGPDVPLETAQRAGEFLFGYLPIPAFLDDAAANQMRGMCELEPVAQGWSPYSIEIDAWDSGRGIVRTYAGDTLNRTLSGLLEAAGFRVSGGYDLLEIKVRSGSAENLRKRLARELADIAESDNTALESQLLESQSSFSFSPFTRMLPDHLARSALVDQTMDVDGLQTFLRPRL